MRRLALSAGAVLTLALAALTTAVSQQSAQSSSGAQATFKATTRIVNVNVEVTDSYGNPITGLTKDDFELFDNGKRQNITFFTAIKNVAPAPAAALPPDTYTNRLPTDGAPPSVTALLIDVQDSDWPAQVYSLNRVRAFLRQLQPDDRIAMYLLTDDKFTVLHDFTQDSSDLVAAIQRYDAQHTGPKDQRAVPDSNMVSELDRFLAGGYVKFRFCDWPAISGTYCAYQSTRRSVPLVTVLPDIAQHLASSPGRKSLIWLYGGTFVKRTPNSFLPAEASLQDQLVRRVVGGYSSWPPPRNHGMKAVLMGANPSIESQGHALKDRALKDIRAGLYYGDLVPLLVRLFNDNNIAVYLIGAQGLQTMGPGGFEDLGFKNPDLLSAISHGRDRATFLDEGDTEIQQSMTSLASRTGGRAFYNRNDLETGIEHAIDDGRYSYALAYYPDHNDWSGEWRKIEVKLRDRNKYGDRPSGLAQEVKNLLVGGYGVQVLARGGYFALPEPEPKVPPQHNRKEMLLATANSPSNAVALPLTVRVLPLPGNADSEVLLFLNVDAQNLLTRETENRWRGNFELLFFQVGQQKRPTMLSRSTPTLRRRSEEPVLRKRSEIPDTLEVPVKNYVLELNAAEYQKAIATGMATTRRLKLEPGATTLAIVVHDKTSDAVGSVHIRLDRYAAVVQQPGLH